MAKGGHRRPYKRKKNSFNRENDNELKNMRQAKGRKQQARKSKSLLRQMRGAKWDEDEFVDDLEEIDASPRHLYRNFSAWPGTLPGCSAYRSDKTSV